ncbi:hypothetical protein Pelo_17923 [Pelomyxa schiedti]|nr:hypothetical protein Pelo_17923 [Pelomyxa schiedti]
MRSGHGAGKQGNELVACKKSACIAVILPELQIWVCSIPPLYENKRLFGVVRMTLMISMLMSLQSAWQCRK